MYTTIKWKARPSMYEHEGYVGKVKLFSIQGNLCVTDLRPTKKEVWEAPQHYKIKDVEDGRQVAYDLLNGLNFDVHEKNRLDWILEGERTAKLMQEADEFIKRLKKEEKLRETQLKLDL